MADPEAPATQLSRDALGKKESVGIKGSPEIVGQISGVSAQLLTPQAPAGLSLAKTILHIAVGAIVAPIMDVFIEDTLDGLRVKDVYADIMQQASVSGEPSDPVLIDGVIALLEKGIATQSMAATESDVAKERSLEDMLSRLNTLSPGQRSSLGRCVPFPATADRVDILRSCADLLQVEAKASRSSAANLDKLRIMVDFSKEVDARHQS